MAPACCGSSWERHRTARDALGRAPQSPSTDQPRLSAYHSSGKARFILEDMASTTPSSPGRAGATPCFQPALPEGPKLCRCGAGRRMQCCCLSAACTWQRTAGGSMSPAHHQLDTNTTRGGSLAPLHLPRQPPSQGQALEPEPRAPPFPFLHPPGAVRIVLLYTFLRVAVLFC